MKMQCTINNPEVVKPELDRELFIPLSLTHVQSCFCTMASLTNHEVINEQLKYPSFFSINSSCGESL